MSLAVTSASATASTALPLLHPDTPIQEMPHFVRLTQAYKPIEMVKLLQD